MCCLITICLCSFHRLLADISFRYGCFFDITSCHQTLTTLWIPSYNFALLFRAVTPFSLVIYHLSHLLFRWFSHYVLHVVPIPIFSNFLIYFYENMFGSLCSCLVYEHIVWYSSTVVFLYLFYKLHFRICNIITRKTNKLHSQAIIEATPNVHHKPTHKTTTPYYRSWSYKFTQNRSP